MEIKDLIKGIRSKRNRLRTGYVYAPYIMVQNVSVISGSYSPKKSLSSRYSTKNINSKYYSNTIIK